MRKVFIGILVLAVLLFAGCQSSSNTKIDPVDTFCRSIIPDRINLTNYVREDGTEVWSYVVPDLPRQNFSWKDGTPMSAIDVPNLWFQRGYRTGQNVNLLYGNLLKYEKTPISPEGVIGDMIEYHIMVILNFTNRTDEGFMVSSYKCCKNSPNGPDCVLSNVSFKKW
jgi:hypothetical protein